MAQARARPPHANYPKCVTVPKGTDVVETNHFDDETRGSHWPLGRRTRTRHSCCFAQSHDDFPGSMVSGVFFCSSQEEQGAYFQDRNRVKPARPALFTLAGVKERGTPLRNQLMYPTSGPGPGSQILSPSVLRADFPPFFSGRTGQMAAFRQRQAAHLTRPRACGRARYTAHARCPPARDPTTGSARRRRLESLEKQGRRRLWNWGGGGRARARGRCTPVPESNRDRPWHKYARVR